MSFTRVTSPIDGRVSRAEVTRGNLVTGGNNGGTLLTSVVSIDPMYLYFEGDEATYLRYTNWPGPVSGRVRATRPIPCRSGWPTRRASRTRARWTSWTTS